jgi:hypothetical protein
LDSVFILPLPLLGSCQGAIRVVSQRNYLSVNALQSYYPVLTELAMTPQLR